MSEFNITVPGGRSAKLLTGGKFCPGDIIVTAGKSVPIAEKDVNFYDYDGTLLYAYTLDEIQALTELPVPPSPDPEYLVFQEWNWTLDELKDLHDVMDVGANYQTVDGCTKLFMTIDDEKLMTVALNFRWNSEIDWGDGTKTSAGENVTSTHTYSALGNYVISCTGWSTGMRCTVADSIGNLSLRKVYIGNNITALSFNQCSLLTSVSLPNNGKMTLPYSDSFRNTAVVFLAIPKPVSDIGYRALREVTYKNISFPNTVAELGEYSIYAGAPFATRIVLPPSLTKIKTYSFYGYSRLLKITIPANVTEIGNDTLRYCGSLSEIHMKPTTPPTLGGTGAFADGLAGRIIFTPKGCLEAYRTATNWATYASQMREEST